MTVLITGFGTRVNVRASVTYPAGVTISQFGDDADPIDITALQIADVAMGLNGDLVAWSKANPIKLSFNLITGSDDENSLSTLLDANRVGQGKIGANDTITLSIIYPDNSVITYTKGVITDGMPGKGIQSAGRYKTNNYAFAFENKQGS